MKVMRKIILVILMLYLFFYENAYAIDIIITKETKKITIQVTPCSSSLHTIEVFVFSVNGTEFDRIDANSPHDSAIAKLLTRCDSNESISFIDSRNTINKTYQCNATLSYRLRRCICEGMNNFLIIESYPWYPTTSDFTDFLYTGESKLYSGLPADFKRVLSDVPLGCYDDLEPFKTLVIRGSSNGRFLSSVHIGGGIFLSKIGSGPLIFHTIEGVLEG